MKYSMNDNSISNNFIDQAIRKTFHERFSIMFVLSLKQEGIRSYLVYGSFKLTFKAITQAN